MIGSAELLWGGIVPAAVAAVTLFIVWRFTKKSASAWRTALVAGYLVGCWTLDANNISRANNFGEADFWSSTFSLDLSAALAKSYQPVEAHHWVPILMVIAILPDALACLGQRGPLVGWLLRIPLCLFVPWRLFRGSAYLPWEPLPDFGFETQEWSSTEALGWIGGLGATLLFLWLTIRAANETQHFITRSILAVLVTLAAAITAALSGSIYYGQLFGILTGTLAGAGLASALLKTARDSEAAAGPLVIVYGSLLMLGCFFAELKFLYAVLLLVAMIVAIGWLPRLEKLAPAVHTTLRVVICLVLLATTVTLAGRDFAATQAETEANPYSAYQ